MKASFVLFWLITLICLHLSAAAADITESSYSSTGTPVSVSFSEQYLIDRYHEKLSQRVRRYVTRLDYFISPSHTEEEEPGSWIMVQPKIEFENGSGVSVGANFKAKLELPHLTKRLEVIADNIPGALLPGADLPDNFTDVNAGLRWKVIREDFSWLNMDGGMNLNPLPAPFLRLTFSHSVPVRKWMIFFKQQGFWYNQDDGFGEMTEIDFDRSIPSVGLFRSTSAATWSEETDGLEWEQTVKLGKIVKKNKHSIVAQFSVFGHNSSSSVMDEYRANFTYRFNAYRPWLFFNVTPQIAFPRDRDFAFTPLLRVSVEIFFGDQYLD